MNPLPKGFPVLRHLLCGAALLLLLTPNSAQQPLPESVPGFVRTDSQIPMRDGVKLHYDVLRAQGRKEPLPFIFLRTPYGIEPRGPKRCRSICKDLADDGYIFVFQDIRGRYKSEGKFVMIAAAARPERPQGHRRGHRHLRHHRLAAQERARQQRPGRHARHLLSAAG